MYVKQMNVASPFRSENVVKNKGRPRLSYEEGSQKTKKRRVEQLASTYSSEELSKALNMKAYHCQSDNESETDTKDLHDESYINNILAMYMDLELTKRKYEKLRSYNERISGNKSYPPYLIIQKAKKACYPYEEHVESSDVGASVHFISLLGHTAKRILLELKKDDLGKLINKKLVLVGKWGMDGASGQQMTRQKWSCHTCISTGDESCDNVDENGIKNCNVYTNNSDIAVFLISFVPLQLKADNIAIWTNKSPSSVHYCRPVKFEFIKESNSHVQKEYKFYTDLLKKVQIYNIEIENMSFEISFDLKCTMIDGKVCNVLTEQKASNCCNICNVGPKFVNDLSYVTKLQCNEDFYQFGLSTLHCWIRCLKYLLHVTYNLDFQKGSARTNEHKELKKTRKKHIQNVLKSKLSLLLDVVKQGSGTTNTGNVARSFFAQAEAVAKITGLSEYLITRLHNVLQVLTCGKMIDCEKFKIYCLETAELCVQLYPWYPLPPSVHKLLIHGSEIVKIFDLPIGWLSEEPQEANNKIFRKARAYNSRMSNRTLTNQDIMHHLLISSDPLINSLRIKEDRKIKSLSQEAENLIIPNV